MDKGTIEMETRKLSKFTHADLMTPLKAIRARCVNCRGFEKITVRECDLTDCPLHALRMGRGARATLRVIRTYCLDCCVGQRAKVRQCPATGCPLWQYRAGRRPKTTRLMSEIGSTAGGFGRETEHRPIYPFKGESGRLSTSRDRVAHPTRPVSRPAFLGSNTGRGRGRDGKETRQD
jgi:hypothetical protein